MAICKEYALMLRKEEENVSLVETLSEGAKLLALVGIFGIVFLFIAAVGCNHQACSVPDTWKPAIEFVQGMMH